MSFLPCPNLCAEDVRALDAMNAQISEFKWRVCLDTNPMSDTYAQFIFLDDPDSGFKTYFDSIEELKEFVDEEILVKRLYDAAVVYMRHVCQRGVFLYQALDNVGQILAEPTWAAREAAEAYAHFYDKTREPAYARYSINIAPRRPREGVHEALFGDEDALSQPAEDDDESDPPF